MGQDALGVMWSVLHAQDEAGLLEAMRGAMATIGCEQVLYGIEMRLPHSVWSWWNWGVRSLVAV